MDIQLGITILVLILCGSGLFYVFRLYLQTSSIEERDYSAIVAFGNDWFADTSVMYWLNYVYAEIDGVISYEVARFYASRETKDGFVLVYASDLCLSALPVQSSASLVHFVLVEDVQNWQTESLYWHEEGDHIGAKVRPIEPPVYGVPMRYLSVYPTGQNI